MVFSACMWIYTKCVLREGRKPTPEMQEYLKRRILSIMLCVNSVCEGAFDHHEWVFENTIDMQVEDVLGMDLDYELCIPCVVQSSMLWFSAPTRFNLKQWKMMRKKKKRQVPRSSEHGDYGNDHTAVGDPHTPRTCTERHTKTGM